MRLLLFPVLISLLTGVLAVKGGEVHRPFERRVMKKKVPKTPPTTTAAAATTTAVDANHDDCTEQCFQEHVESCNKSGDPNQCLADLLDCINNLCEVNLYCNSKRTWSCITGPYDLVAMQVSAEEQIDTYLNCLPTEWLSGLCYSGLAKNIWEQSKTGSNCAHLLVCMDP
eukprot:scaffold18498_cov186-Amphora_coffeaeformis.AAC.5